MTEQLLDGADVVVFDAERLARLVEQGGEVRRQGQRIEADKRMGEMRGGGRRGGWQVEGTVKDLTIEEEHSEAGLAALAGIWDGVEERQNIGRGQRVGVTFIVEEDETFDPGDSGFFGAGRIVAGAQGVADTSTQLSAGLIEQFRGL